MTTWKPYAEGDLTKSQFALLNNQQGYQHAIQSDEVEDAQELVNRGLMVKTSRELVPVEAQDYLRVADAGRAYVSQWIINYREWLTKL